MNKTISRLHYITQDLPNISHLKLAENACLAGIEWVQLRVKDKPYNEWLKVAAQVQSVCREHNVKLIINDNLDIAKEIKADGVHLGKTDVSPFKARKLLGTRAIIGGTANTFEDVEYLVNCEVDYIGLGPYNYTTTKENLSPILGLHGYKRIMERCATNKIKIPIIAIGGITTGDVMPIMETKIYGIAVSSAINKSTDAAETVRQMQSRIKFSIATRSSKK